MNNIVPLKRKTVISTLSLFFQSGYSAFLGLIANLFLTILLSPSVFGIYITVLSLISLLNYFSDIGLAASLVQKKEISDADIKTTFTIQQILIITIIGIGFAATNIIKNFYNLPIDGIYLYWALLLAFFLSSLKTMPSIFLERQVQFQKIVLVQIVENTVFYAIVIIFAIMGFGLRSFIFAVFARSIVGVILIYSLSFWLPKVGVSRVSLKELLSFGVPFQASSFLALFKDDLITLYLGKVLGFTGLGYIGWAKKWAEAPIRIIMDNISRVLFPVIARLQNDKEKVGKLVNKILYYQTILLAPTILGLAVVIRPFVEVIPKYGKWAPALPIFYLICVSAFLSSYSTPFINLFNALGKVKISFSFMLFWTAATWFFTPILTKYFGYLGFPITQVILSSTVLFVLWQARKIINFNFFGSIYKSLFSGFLMATILFFVSKLISTSFLGLFILVILGFVSYLAFLKILFKIDIAQEIKSLFTYE